ncbi:hypothetical protein [Natronosalvus halobius]|uniref:hypothetical protein n=1 Tax=Natronosalvus halobius TaxID=2953746 RepID=UPI00209F167D|nr:hypothetical protein [Natronosalvus halobius]USZ72952.1 hypothetical protein NGM15_06515 [Natronosalvus halobius]
MKRRRYLLGVITVPTAGVAGCLSRGSTPDDGSDLTPEDDRDVETVATETFDTDFTPICADGESLESDVEGSYAELVTDHEFFRDAESGRYGVRGRIGPWEGGNIPEVRAEFSDESHAKDTGFGVAEDETYLFTVMASEGNPDAIEGYTLSTDGGGVEDIGPASEEYVTLDGDWGQIGTYDDAPVYGYVGRVDNNHTKDVTLYPHLKAYLDETTVAYAGQSTELGIDVASGDTQTVYFPYPRCDPAKIEYVEGWLAWATMDNP